MRKFTRALAVTGAAAALVVGAATAANATVIKEGGALSCPHGEFVQFDVIYSGIVSIYYPSTSTPPKRVASHNSFYETTYSTNVTSVSSWRIAVTGGSLSDASTAECEPNV